MNPETENSGVPDGGRAFLPVLVGLASALLLPTIACGATDAGWFNIGNYEVRTDDLWTIATAACCSVSCAIVGCFLVLRRLSLLGDAISHAILPGLAVAFLLTGSRDPLPMLAGAAGAGLLTALASASLSRWGRIADDASMGVVFTTMFAIGVILVTWVARHVDLDPGCVLYGLIEFVPLDTVKIAGIEAPRAFVWLAVMLAVDVAFVAFLFKELKIVCFDPALATTLGISAAAIHYALMASVACTTVASFESVGSILVVTMLVAPGATAHLLTDRLSTLVWLAALIAALAAVLGYIGAVYLNTSVAGAIAVASLLLFILTVIAAPRHGVIARQARRLSLAARICREDLLGALFRHAEVRVGVDSTMTPATLAGEVHQGVLGRLVLGFLIWQGMIRRTRAGLGVTALALSARGAEEARRIIRGHRLWESYLVAQADRDPADVHSSAHAAEHFLGDDLRHDLGKAVPADIDPHGRPIP